MKKIKLSVSSDNINDFLGIKKFKYGEVETENKVGIVTGLAWTEFGGEILKIETFICQEKVECKSQVN